MRQEYARVTIARLTIRDRGNVERGHAERAPRTASQSFVRLFRTRSI